MKETTKSLVTITFRPTAAMKFQNEHRQAMERTPAQNMRKRQNKVQEKGKYITMWYVPVVSNYGLARENKLDPSCSEKH